MSEYLYSYYTVRFNDCDPFNHLNNSRYIDYFMNAREEQLMQFYGFSLAESYKKGQAWVVRSNQIVYLRPASYNEKIKIETGVLDLQEEQITVEMLMLDENGSQLKAILHATFIPVNMQTGKRDKHTSELMEFFTPKVLPGNHAAQTINERIAELQQTKLKRPETAG